MKIQFKDSDEWRQTIAALVQADIDFAASSAEDRFIVIYNHDSDFDHEACRNAYNPYTG